MKTEIMLRPANTIAKLEFDLGDEVTAESGCLVAMSPGLQMETVARKKKNPNILGRLLTGESIFMNEFTAQAQGAKLFITPRLSGDIAQYKLEASKSIFIQSNSYLASWGNVEIGFSWQGLKNFFSKENLFWIHCSGDGDILFNSFGAVYEVDVDGDYIVDTGHIVAFESGLNFTIEKAASTWIDSFFSGEGLVTKFHGKGKVWCQSHNSLRFGIMLGSQLKSR